MKLTNQELIARIAAVETAIAIIQPDLDTDKLPQSIFDGKDPEYIYAARDRSGRTDIYSVVPTQDNVSFYSTPNKRQQVRSTQNYRGNWKNSLTVRQNATVTNTKPELLTQEIFEGIDPKFKYAAIQETGLLMYFVDEPQLRSSLWLWGSGTVFTAQDGYPTTKWSESLIKRVPLQGSELVKAMLARGDTHIMCMVTENACVPLSRRILDVVREFKDGNFIVGHDKDRKWSIAVPINNKQEELTAADVGL